MSYEYAHKQIHDFVNLHNFALFSLTTYQVGHRRGLYLAWLLIYASVNNWDIIGLNIIYIYGLLHVKYMAQDLTDD